MASPLTVLIWVALVLALGGVAFALGRWQGRRMHAVHSPLRAEELRRIPFFRHLSSDQLVRVAALVRELRMTADAYLIREHHHGDALYLVLEGQLNILKRGAHQETLVKTVGPGEFIGEMSILNGSRTVASAKTATAAVLLQIERADFQDFLNADADIAQSVWEACEVHTIDLLLRDHPPLRALPLAQRQRWIEARRGEFTSRRHPLRPSGPGYLAIVTGEVISDTEVIAAPRLLRVEGGERFEIAAGGRVVWLEALPVAA